MNYLAKENCNKAKCKSCMFGDTPINLSEDRLNEINGYLTGLQSSHVCHVTNKTCFGGLEVQARTVFEMGIIPDPSVDTFLETAQKVLNL
jgi:hypothetical protein